MTNVFYILYFIWCQGQLDCKSVPAYPYFVTNSQFATNEACVKEGEIWIGTRIGEKDVRGFSCSQEDHPYGN